MEHISVKKKTDRLIITHKIEKNEQISSMELDIINKAEIPALLPIHYRRKLVGREFRFTVQNYISLRSYLKSGVSFSQFVQIVSQIIETIQSCESHGIRCGNLELNSDLSFYDYSKHQVRMICWPLISVSVKSSVASFFLELGSIYIGRSRDGDYRLQYLQFFDSRADFDLVEFQYYVDMLLKQWVTEQEEHRAGKGKVIQKKTPDLPPTVGLRTSSIHRISTGTVIQISRYPFSIGRIAEFCDYALEENQYISRKHVTILLRNGQAYIRDNGSSNGTLLNEKRLPANTDVPLVSGDCFRISNEEFIFYPAGEL